MNAFKRPGIFMMIAAAGLFSAGCNNSDDDATPPSVRFSSSSSTVNEGDGTVEIQISATEAVTSDVAVTFEVTGSAYLDGDYSVETASPVTIPAGSQTAKIVLKLIDESTIESTDDDLTINLTAIGANAKLSTKSSDLEYALTITDNDNSASDKLQIDLTWDISADESINKVNLDLYLATNVVIENNVVTSADLYSQSKATTGFETLWITQDDEDAEYYIVVNYTTGSSAVDFTLNLNGEGLTNESTTESLTSSDVGAAVFYGPITKSGSSIGRKENARMHYGNLTGSGI